MLDNLDVREHCIFGHYLERKVAKSHAFLSILLWVFLHIECSQPEYKIYITKKAVQFPRKLKKDSFLCKNLSLILSN